MDMMAQQPQAQQPPQANPLAALVGQQQQQQQPPQLSMAQTVAGVHKFAQIKAAMLPVIDDPHLGKTNIRPKLLDATSKLLMSKTLSLPEIMNRIKDLPDDPQKQKQFVDQIYQSSDQAQKVLLANAAHAHDDGEQWSADSHDKHLAGMMQQYGGRNG
jgi:hypothetical protein